MNEEVEKAKSEEEAEKPNRESGKAMLDEKVGQTRQDKLTLKEKICHYLTFKTNLTCKSIFFLFSLFALGGVLVSFGCTFFFYNLSSNLIVIERPRKDYVYV